MNALTALASAAFGSTVHVTTLSTVGRLNQLDPRVKVAGWTVTAIVLCAVLGTIVFASRSVVVGFILGAALTPPVHRWILQRRAHAARF
ncbi:hypothetical protein ACFCXA_22960 [Streptomyces virginiae]|uniref:hypothetical protein n=1 Tax=Streptomyces virginiae TaxID=1961 RepID=UPI0035DF5F5A